jgi:hypothetical protein
VPLYPLVPAVFVVGELGVVAGTFLNKNVRGSAVFAAGWVVGAGVLYALVFWRRGAMSPEGAAVLEESQP